MVREGSGLGGVLAPRKRSIDPTCKTGKKNRKERETRKTKATNKNTFANLLTLKATLDFVIPFRI